LEGEVITWRCSAQDTCPRGTYDLNAKVIENESSIFLVAVPFGVAWNHTRDKMSDREGHDETPERQRCMAEACESKNKTR